MAEFMKNPTGNLVKAAGYYSSIARLLSKLQLLKNARGPFHLWEGPFLLFMASTTSEMGLRCPLWVKADIVAALAEVRFAPYSGHSQRGHYVR